MAQLTEEYLRNVTAISNRYPTLAKELLKSEPNRHFHVVVSRTGKPVPVHTADGETIHLNSPYDPEKEAKRIADTTIGTAGSPTSYLLPGFDGGYLSDTLLRPDVELVIVVEYELPYLRFLIESFDLSKQLSDPRLRLIISDSPAAASNALLDEYLPLFHGDIAIIPRRPRERMNEPFFSGLRKRIPDVLKLAAVDISTQKKFGLRWINNIVSNVEPASLAGRENYDSLSDFAGRIIHVTAAGPSLEDSFSSLSRANTDECIVATDTSLPSLIAAGVAPHFVVSVDCQMYSYHHFLQGIPDGTRLVLDLTSPPSLYRSGSAVIPVAGGHPFAGYVSRFFFPFIRVDTSGGNVTHAAVSFADRLAGKKIVLHGADFSYPEGKLYARETYLYPYFRSGEIRTSSLDTNFARMLLERSDLSLEHSEGGTVIYKTALLESYKQRLKVSTAGIVTPITAATETPFPQNGRTACNGRIRTHGEEPIDSRKTWLSFYRELLHDLDSLEIPACALHSILDGLDPKGKMLLFSLMPLSAFYQKKEKRLRGDEILETARKEARRIIDRSLSRQIYDRAVTDE